MSILVNGMEMPTSCRACKLKINCDDCEGWECVCLPLQTQIGYLDDLLTDKRRDDCPLIPVPKHGRLIDADSLAQSKKCKRKGCVYQEEIYRAPTVIPEESECN